MLDLGSLPFAPAMSPSVVTTLDVLGGLSTRDDGTTTAITADNQTVTVGNRSYIRLTSTVATAANATVRLSNGLQRGQRLVVEHAGSSNQFEIGDSDSDAATNADTSGAQTMTVSDTIELIWNGSNWLKISYSAN